MIYDNCLAFAAMCCKKDYIVVMNVYTLNLDKYLCVMKL